MRQRTDPFLSNRFRVALEIDGITEAGFTECSGLVVEIEIEERREGGVNDRIHKLRRGAKYPNIILKRGLTASDYLWKWHQEFVSGSGRTAKNLSVVLLDRGGSEQWRWNITDAYPVKWTGPDLKADGNAVAIETLELAHHGLAKG